MSVTHRGLYLAVVLSALYLASDGAEAAAPDAHVTIQDSRFSPLQLTTKVGAAVTWTNADDEPHTVVSDSGRFRSGALETGKAYTHTFDEPGTYTVYCARHPQRLATILVQ